MSHYYFDAAPLVSWADARAPNANPYDAKVATVVQSLVEGPEVTAVSEVTLLEVHSKICDHWRATEYADRDEAWADDAINGLMRWLQAGQLRVLSPPPKLAETAMVHLEAVTRTAGLKLRAWDAAHISQALNWSRELGERVVLVTGDGDYGKVIAAVPALQDHLDLLDPSA